MDRRSAGFLPRLGAFALDLLPIMGYILIVLGIGLAVTLGQAKGQTYRLSDRPVLFDGVAFLTVILPVILYFTWSESSEKKATWGKRRLRLQVVTTEGDRSSFGRALLRSAVKFLPWQMAHTGLFHIPGWPLAVTTIPTWVVTVFIILYALLAVYFLTLLVRPHRTPYDWIAGTMVVSTKRE